MVHKVQTCSWPLTSLDFPCCPPRGLGSHKRGPQHHTEMGEVGEGEPKCTSWKTKSCGSITLLGPPAPGADGKAPAGERCHPEIEGVLIRLVSLSTAVNAPATCPYPWSSTSPLLSTSPLQPLTPHSLPSGPLGQSSLPHPSNLPWTRLQNHTP